MAVSQANFFPEPYILYWNDCNGKAKSDFLGKKSGPKIPSECLCHFSILQVEVHCTK